MSEPVALSIALLFGIIYDQLLVWLARRWPQTEGLKAFWVVIGVLITLGISAGVAHQTVRMVFYWRDAELVLTNAQHAAFFELRFFCAAGLPMVFGGLWRYWQTL